MASLARWWLPCCARASDPPVPIMRRVLTLIRRHFPDTHILVRGDGHFSGPELMQMIDAMPNTDFIFGFSSNAKLQALSRAQPSTVIAKLFKIAVLVKQSKQRVTLHLPSACPVKDLLHTLAERLFVSIPANIVNSS